jgi:DNA-binding response OmpR family regulator
MKVLIAEDETRTRGMLAEVVVSLGHEPLIASSGFEAVRLVQENRPEVLLLDGLLPEMHGFEIARFVRGFAADYHPRIIIITAIYKGQRYQSEAKLQFGVDRYLLKPVSREAVAAAIQGETG